MTDLPVLVDSNIFIGLLRAGRDPARILTEQFGEVDLVTCGVIRLEVLRGIKLEPVKERLGRFLDAMQTVPADGRLWEEATELAWRLDRLGQVIPATDILIAVCALRAGALVLTHDRHFEAIPGLRLVPGTIP